MTSSEISYTEARSNFGALLDRVADNKDIIIVQRDGEDRNVALIAEADLSSLIETCSIDVVDGSRCQLAMLDSIASLNSISASIAFFFCSIASFLSTGKFSTRR
jgi:prevent-host-death family protein